jgi:hypothetical protein
MDGVDGLDRLDGSASGLRDETKPWKGPSAAIRSDAGELKELSKLSKPSRLPAKPTR